MSTLAARQSQKENIDVNNFWRWPTEISNLGINPPNSFKPEYMKWMSSSNSGYVRKFDPNKCQFTDHSVTARQEAGYQANVFLDLKPGKYVMSFDVDIQFWICIDTYFFTDGENVKYGNAKNVFNGSKGHNDLSFEILNGSIVMIHFHGIPEGEWTTFTNIRIREGIL